MRTESEIIETHRADTKDMQHNTVTHAFLFGFGCRNRQVCHLKYTFCRLNGVTWNWIWLFSLIFASWLLPLFLPFCIIFLRLTFLFFLNLKTTLLSDFLLSRFYTNIIVISLINNHSFSFHLWGADFLVD